ncbi:MAG: hypothetical protein AAGF26_12740 [Cyanobacteria bacterium P01_G01_bin.49]
MSPELEDLLINREQVEKLIDLEVITSIAVDFYRALKFKNNRQILSILFTELSTFIVVLILVMPVTLILLRGIGQLPNDPAGINQIIINILGICLLLMLFFNIYLFRQIKKIKSLATLIEKLDHYNQVIQSIILVEGLESAKGVKNQLNYLSHQQELFNALRITKESLLSALEVEKIIRKHKNLIDYRYELFSNLENNLTALMSFETNHQNYDYEELLKNALQIGMTVHKEVKKLNQK